MSNKIKIPKIEDKKRTAANLMSSLRDFEIELLHCNSFTVPRLTRVHNSDKNLLKFFCLWLQKTFTFFFLNFENWLLTLQIYSTQKVWNGIDENEKMNSVF